jgi:hypothetical protein
MLTCLKPIMGNWEIDFKKFLVGKNSQTQNP